jgi:hypothetical protein
MTQSWLDRLLALCRADCRQQIIPCLYRSIKLTNLTM